VGLVSRTTGPEVTRRPELIEQGLSNYLTSARTVQLSAAGRCAMGRPKKVRESLPPIWRVSDEQWATIEPILAAHDPPARKGPGRVDQRAVFDAVIFRLRTGCQWNWLPKEYPDDSTVHRHFQRWVQRGIFDRIWATVQEACEDLGGCAWEWQAADGWLGKARLGGRAWAPTPLIEPRTA
jgi:transposase